MLTTIFHNITIQLHFRSNKCSLDENKDEILNIQKCSFIPWFDWFGLVLYIKSSEVNTGHTAESALNMSIHADCEETAQALNNWNLLS